MVDPGLSPADEALVVAYVDGDLSDDDRAAFERRLESEPRLEEALNAFLVADELGRELGREKLLTPTRRHRRRGFLLLLSAMTMTTAAVLLLMRRPVEADATFRILKASAVRDRSGNDPTTAIEFRSQITIARECYVLLLSVSAIDESIEVRQQHPLEADPFAGGDPDALAKPFAAGRDVSLPEPLADGTEHAPFSMSASGLVVLCTKTGAPFSVTEIQQLKDDVRVTATNRREFLRRLPSDDADPAIDGFVEPLRTRERANWKIHCLVVRPR